MPPLRTSRFLLLFLFFGNVWKVLPKSIPDRGPLEVLIRVQVFDNSDLSPLPDATVEVHGNQSTPSTGRAGSDGIATVTLLYRPGTWVIIAASKPGYVTNSAPWHAKRIPLYASISLYLLPQRPATLILYEDVVQVLLGSPGSRRQPWVQFQRRAIGLTLNSTYAELTAMLTAAKSQYEIGGFPYPLGQESANSTGSDIGWADLTAVAAVSAHLVDQNGTVVQVVPVWRFEAQKGLWVRNGTGYIKKDGTQMTWSFVASQLGYWLAAFPTDTGMAVNPPGLGDITTYHTIFLLAILGSLALLVLVLLCLLLYHCRRRCLKPRQQHHKLQASSALDGSRRDQGTSTSHLHLISSGRPDTGSACARRRRRPQVRADLAGRVLPGRPGPQDKRRNGGGGGSSANDNQGYASDPPSPPPSFAGRYQDSRPPEYSASQPADPLARAAAPLNTQPGQLIFCSSMDQMNESMYRSVVPTLVIPAHYMRLSSDLSAVEQALEQQQLQQQDREGIQVSVTLPRPGGPGQPGPQQQQQQQQQQGQRGAPQQQQEGEDPVRIPVLFDDSAMSQMSEELQALTEQKLLELGVKPHPGPGSSPWTAAPTRWCATPTSSWGTSAARRPRRRRRRGRRLAPWRWRGPHPRQGGVPAAGGSPSGRRGAQGRAAKAYARPGVRQRRQDAHRRRRRRRGQGCPELARGQLLAPLLDEAPGPRGPPSPAGAQQLRAGGGGGGGGTRRSSATSPEVEENDLDDKDDDGENKKSPWQRREERPLMVFNVK
ncbi:hypothetical protein ANANG_G00296610 [Anguilla anguilla]|uniref:Protein FAM171A2 n=1 Tax=Anguilla anguilla TaxID=7936 RepID=A0A9D3RMC8_ANGAN|nr:hypothetical protein ANANG_G00296610 [Anguilla anguilla]